MRNIPGVIRAIQRRGDRRQGNVNEVRQVLQQAKELLECGWHQGSYAGEDSAVCMRAAISLAAGVMSVEPDGTVGYLNKNRGINPLRRFAHAVNIDIEACRVVKECLPEPWQSIPGYNDSDDTTFNDILAVMDKAIAAC